MKWSFSCSIRWLPYILTVVLLKLIYVTKVVKLLLSFQISMPHFESGWQSRYYSYSSIHTHPSQCGSCLSWGQLLPQCYLFPHILKDVFHLWGHMEVDPFAFSCTNPCQCYYTVESLLLLGALGLNDFNHPWTYQVSYVILPPALVPLVVFQFLAEHVKG